MEKRMTHITLCFCMYKATKRHRKQEKVSQEDIHGRHNLSVMHSDISHTTINMFFFKTYIGGTI